MVGYRIGTQETEELQKGFLIGVAKEDSDADSSELKVKIDQPVYKLYRLSEEDNAIVEERVG